MRLLRILLTTAFLLMAAPAATAQLLPSFGVTGGLNFSNLTDAAALNLDQAVGFHAGIYADFGFGPLALRGALIYTRAGQIEDPDSGETMSVEFIGIPLDVKYVVSLPVVKPYVLIGPELRFPLGDIRQNILTRQMPVAVSFGAGVDIGAFIGPQAFVELRYSLDVSGFLERDESLRVSLFYLRVGVGI